MRAAPLFRTLLGALVLASAGCGGAAEPELRGTRYCEILLGTYDATSGKVRIDVYNTQGLSDCPQEAWSALSPSALMAETRSSVVVLNGPRYWVIDGFSGSSVLDPEVRTLGGMAMRRTGALELLPAETTGSSAAYATRSVRRDTTWTFHAGRSVYELIDPAGAIYDMQSYSVQRVAQSEATLATLGEVLKPPSGWRFRTRVLEAPLTVTAVDGLAVVVQDELGNTYQRSRQAP